MPCKGVGRSGGGEKRTEYGHHGGHHGHHGGRHHLLPEEERQEEGGSDLGEDTDCTGRLPHVTGRHSASLMTGE